ncbi:MAG TPA: dTDP-4-dehydrorhamnose 3,5-epimerase [Pyrinomonadaceae bacterium]|jgi:dTDP-4-dehydrorhamnose 3,5-epimerase
MIFKETKLKGAYVVEPERFGDERGFFARSWSAREFAAEGLDARMVECNISFNKRRGTLRGMHFQAAPHAQAKVVRCTLGAVFDCIVDLRPDSETFKRWFALELSAENRLMLYVPEGFAHGFQTLEDDSEVFYQMSQYYAQESGRGVRWDDPAFRIEWPPTEERIIIARDREYPDFDG